MSIKKGSYVIAGTPRTTGGVEIGDIGFAPLGIDESLNLRRYLNGQVISQTQFVSFTNKVKAAVALFPNLSTTETNWQAEKTNSKLGQCGKFVIDDTAGTIRLPAVVNAQGLLELSGIGNLVNESLPNITGYINNTSPSGQDYFEGGALYWQQKNYNYPSALNNKTDKNYAATIRFDASRSSSTYQDNAPVQQEAVQYPYYIQVATGVEETLPAIREYNINTPFFFGQSMYSDVAPANASWLASNGQYNAKTVYPDYYDWLVEQMNAGVSGFVASTAAYTDYDFVINTADQTFRLPLLDGSEDLPGDRYENLTLQASGSSYIAPANGWYVLYKGSNASGQYNESYSPSNRLRSMVQSSYSGGTSTYIFVKKGDVYKPYYSVEGKTNEFVFVYATGNGSLYYYVGDAVQDASLINAGAVLGQLSNKADIDASNFNADGKSLLSGLGMPSGRYIDLTLGASNSTYTAPANGYFSIYVEKGDSTQAVVRLENGSIAHQDTRGYGSTTNLPLYSYIPVCKGQNVRCTHNYTGTFRWFRFIYAEGESNV